MCACAWHDMHGVCTQGFTKGGSACSSSYLSPRRIKGNPDIRLDGDARLFHVRQYRPILCGHDITTYMYIKVL